jgi:hypothetical protein
MSKLSAIKLAKFFEREINLSKSLLIVDISGTYELFGRYRIEPKENYFVIYDIKTRTQLDFSTLKYATAWCILTESNKLMESRRLQMLDLKLTSLYTDIQIHRKMLKTSSNSSVKLLHTIKLQEDSYKRKTVIKEIDMYINNSKTLQVKKFTSKKERNFKYL